MRAMGLALAVGVAGAAGMAGLGCTKDEGAAPAASASASAPMPTATVTAAASASPTASASAAASATATATASATAVATASGKPAASAKPAATCGDKPMPPCPLYAWMKANTSAAMSAQDFDALAVALDKVVGFAPAGYGNWASISKDGANAARAQSLDGVKASCRGCHNQYKDRYKKEMRDRSI
jgi:hypothetical protein